LPQSSSSAGSAPWRAGQHLTHRFNPDLGIGRVDAVDGRTVVVSFPRSSTTLRLSSATDALQPVAFGPGRPVRVVATREETSVAHVTPTGALRLANGTEAQAHEVWPLDLEGALLERLMLGDVDAVPDFVTRLDLLHLLAIREADGLGSFLGGRIRLFPHQLHVAERATQADPVRWLLADEVGLGKTIEAALILTRLVHTRRVDRCLVVAPETLTVQWLGELWRKYHHVFTLLDGPRLADVAKDFGPAFNPFEVHRRAVIALETLVERPELTAQAVAAGIDLLIVDEAQHLRRPPGHPGEPAWRAVAPIAALGRHVLLLSATPLDEDAPGFFRLLQLLRPEEFPEDDFDARLSSGVALPPCTSATRRADIGGLPPRVGLATSLGDSDGQRRRRAVEDALRAQPAHDGVAARKKVERVTRALASGATLSAVLGAKDDLRADAVAMDGQDPRVVWLCAEAPRWRLDGEKTLLFVEHRETLEWLRTALSHQAQLATGVFHEALSSSRRDIEVARFRDADGPSLLISTECGGEGRNFEFCCRLVLFDLPWRPATVEQRIGRLDRIGRLEPVEVVYFEPRDGLGFEAVRLMRGLRLFAEPLSGLEPQVAPVERVLESLALQPGAALTDRDAQTIVGAAHAARTRVRAAASHELHRDRYRADLAAAVLARVPASLDALTEHVVVRACARLGFAVEKTRGRRTYAIDFGSEALVDSLPGVPGGSTFVGTFDREEAVADESIDFFASGHALVEGVFAHVEESALGRVVRCAVDTGDERNEGLVAFYKEGRRLDIVAFDAGGRARPDWAATFRRRPLRIAGITKPGSGGREWRALVQRLAERLDPSRRPDALASIVVRPFPEPSTAMAPRTGRLTTWAPATADTASAGGHPG
jgi:ATP-dependent helicase HepA